MIQTNKIIFIALIISMSVISACGEKQESTHCDVFAAQMFKALADLNSIETGLKLYQLRNESYPSSLQDLVPSILQSIGDDPWGNAYQYQLGSNGKFILFSTGHNLANEDLTSTKRVTAETDVATIIQEAKSKNLCK